MRTSFCAAAAVVLAAVFTATLNSGAQAAPVAYSRIIAEKVTACDGLIVKAVTRAGVAHRSARRTSRRTSRRVYRRRGY
jgi:ABC-type uncharacterized transport system permease subunit